MEREELKDITISAIALAVAFSVSMSGGLVGIPGISLGTIANSAAIVSTAFILHELAHRFLARRFGCYAEYRMWKHGVIMALLFSLFGFVFAAPGAVIIHPKSDMWGSTAAITRKKSGLISLAGPLTNVLLSAAFFAAFLYYNDSLFLDGASINIWLALFNMIPLPPLDGSKVFFWSRKYWALTFLVVLILSWIL